MIEFDGVTIPGVQIDASVVATAAGFLYGLVGLLMARKTYRRTGSDGGEPDCAMPTGLAIPFWPLYALWGAITWRNGKS